MGGAKGEPGKYLERHSRGRGRIPKATRTLWLVGLSQYNRHATAPLFKNLNKSERSRTDQARKCEQSRTPVSTTGVRCKLQGAGVNLCCCYFLLARSTIRNSVRTAIPVGPFDR